MTAVFSLGTACPGRMSKLPKWCVGVHSLKEVSSKGLHFIIYVSWESVSAPSGSWFPSSLPHLYSLHFARKGIYLSHSEILSWHTTLGESPPGP